VKSHQQLLADVMNRDEKSNKTNEVKRDTGLVSVTEASYLDA
jgi:hypothetical protein